MAKHFYHIPLQKSLTFIKKHNSELATLCTDKKRLAYYRQLGKSYYTLQIEAFILFFKIDKELDYALKTMEYFHSSRFIEEMQKILNFSQFALQANHIEAKEFFYALCYIYARDDAEAFELFMQKSYIHYHTAFNADSNIHIDHQEMCHTLANSKKVTLKESFGEEGNSAFFKLFVEGKLTAEERGKRIKTLRKKAYKKLFYYLIELEDKQYTDAEKAYEMMREM